MQAYLSLIIPAYNEEKRLEKSLNRIFEYFDQKDYSLEVIVVDDGSADNTADIAEQYKRSEINVIRQPKNAGKGAAVRAGMIKASGDVRVFSDADLSTPIYEIEKLFSLLNAGADVAIGSRAVDYSMIKEHQPFYREFMGKTFNKIVQLLVIKGIKDTQCGFKGFTRKAAEAIFPKTRINGFGFDVEVLFLARKFGLTIREVSVEWYNDDRSTVNPITDSFNMLVEILRIRHLHR